MSSRRAVNTPASQLRKRRGLILAAARSEFAELGYAGARVDRIARKAGVNKQLLFYYFGSKAGLYQAALTGAARDLPQGGAPRSPDGGTGAEQLRRAVAQIFDALAERADVTRFILQEAISGGRPDGPAGQVLTRLVRDLAAIISEGQGLGYFRDDADPRVIARHAIVLALSYVGLERVLSDPAAPSTSRLDLRKAVVDLVSQAVAW